jgi:hypothetical protein
MSEHQRVVVHVDDLRVRRDALRHFVSVLHGRQTGTYVEELPYPRLPSEEPHRSYEEPAGLPGLVDDLGVPPGCRRLDGGRQLPNWGYGPM